MRNILIVLTAMVALAALCLPTGAATPQMNGVEVTPGFALTGDNVTIEVLGPGNMYASVSITDETGLAVLETHIMLDSLGRGQYYWTVPIDLMSGEYVVRAVFPGNLSDSERMRVVYDEDVEQTLRLDDMEQRLDRYRLENFRLSAQVDSLQRAKATDTLILSAALLVTLGCLAYMIIKYRERWEWMVARDNRRGARQLIARTLLHPAVPDMVEDQIGYVGPNLRKARQDRAAARKGTVNITPAVILPGPDGMQVLTVNVPDIIMKEKPFPSGLVDRVRRWKR
jgi:hypothetical protein